MSTFAVQVYKNTQTPKPPVIDLPLQLPAAELVNPDLVAAAQDLFADNGVLVINNLFRRDFIRQLHQAFGVRYRSYFADTTYDDALLVGDKRHMLTVDFQAPFNEPFLYGNPLLLSTLEGILGPEFVLGSFGAVIALPGAEAQHIHRDHPALLESPPDALSSFAVTVVVPLIDLTPETGSTRVWKGSHRIDDEVDPPLTDSAVPFPASGGCYLMDYRLLHGGTPNRSNQVRPILYVIYYRSWFQEAVNYDRQSRLVMTQQAYDQVPTALKFLFVRQRETLRTHRALTHQLTRSLANQPFETLTVAEQRRQLEKLAEVVLPQYGFQQAQLDLISHGDNTVFAVQGDRQTTAPSSALSPPSQGDTLQQMTAGDRCVLRIHRPRYLSPAEMASELDWLMALHQHSPVVVPEPLPTLAGKFCPTVQILGMATPRTCSLTRWLPGQFLLDIPRPARSAPQYLVAIGRCLGQLHHYAAQWTPPPTFTRPKWNWDGLFGTRAGYSNGGEQVWSRTPQPYRDLFAAVGAEVKGVMAELGEGAEQFGLIHGDFWTGNLVLQDGAVGAIDFADCGLGYWGYDLARCLYDLATPETSLVVLDDLLQGYTEVRPFPEAQLFHLPLFIAAQQVTLALWRVNCAQDHPGFRPHLDAHLSKVAERVKSLLNLGE
jgi:Ser/Thr protein kinase RdoA (MazF antagonist)/ectoine hydroxylase-related dioxygenase (phytanoyl-CoA dioxygenase family)